MQTDSLPGYCGWSTSWCFRNAVSQAVGTFLPLPVRLRPHREAALCATFLWGFFVRRFSAKQLCMPLFVWSRFVRCFLVKRLCVLSCEAAFWAPFMWSSVMCFRVKQLCVPHSCEAALYATFLWNSSSCCFFCVLLSCEAALCTCLWSSFVHRFLVKQLYLSHSCEAVLCAHLWSSCVYLLFVMQPLQLRVCCFWSPLNCHTGFFSQGRSKHFSVEARCDSCTMWHTTNPQFLKQLHNSARALFGFLLRFFFS